MTTLRQAAEKSADLSCGKFSFGILRERFRAFAFEIAE